MHAKMLWIALLELELKAETRTGVLASDPVDLEQVERQLRQRLDSLGPAPRAELLHVLMLPYFERADRIGELWLA